MYNIKIDPLTNSDSNDIIAYLSLNYEYIWATYDLPKIGGSNELRIHMRDQYSIHCGKKYLFFVFHLVIIWRETLSLYNILNYSLPWIFIF